MLNPYSGLTTPGVVREYLKYTYIVIISQLSVCNITSILFALAHINTKIDAPL